MAITPITSGLVATTSINGALTSSGQTVPVVGSIPQSNVVDATQTPTAERVGRAVNQVNDTFSQRGQNIYASIEIDKTTGMSVVKFVDNNTNEEIGQYPSKAIVAMAESLSQLQDAKGQFLNVSA